jgi:hypothetical protein
MFDTDHFPAISPSTYNHTYLLQKIDNDRNVSYQVEQTVVVRKTAPGENIEETAEKIDCGSHL